MQLKLSLMRNLFRKLLGLCLPVALLFSAHVQAQPDRHEKPNIVLILSDDQGWDDYGFEGHPQIETPHIDTLARGGAAFSRGYVPVALCRPSLASIATGLYPHQTKITGNDPTPASDELRKRLISRIDDCPLIPKLLAPRGYVSFQAGKWWEGHYSRGGFTEGMTQGLGKDPLGRHGDAGLKIGREGMRPVFDFIDRNAGKTPFFLWYAPMMPHTPHNPPDRLFQKYKAKGIRSDHVARYYATVEWFDETCGELLAYLDRKGLRENTLIIYTGDNGWLQDPDSENFIPGSKQAPQDAGIRQPIIFNWPGVIPASPRSVQLASTVDIAPTILGFAGAEIPAAMTGYNLRECLTAGTPTPRTSVFCEGYSHNISELGNPEANLLYRSLIDGEWKLLLTYDGKIDGFEELHRNAERRPQLFNLIDDSHERANLAKDHPEIVARMAAKIAAWYPLKARKAQ
jgi:uncharacterized sulfatase